jgi:hypothetical protein
MGGERDDSMVGFRDRDFGLRVLSLLEEEARLANAEEDDEDVDVEGVGRMGLGSAGERNGVVVIAL